MRSYEIVYLDMQYYMFDNQVYNNFETNNNLYIPFGVEHLSGFSKGKSTLPRTALRLYRVYHIKDLRPFKVYFCLWL